MDQSKRMQVPGSDSSREPGYWIRNPEKDIVTATGQPGPSTQVSISIDGIHLNEYTFHSIGEARWVANRLAEACGIYEMTYGKQTN